MANEPFSPNVNDHDLRRQTLNRASRFGLVVGFIAAFIADVIFIANLLRWSHPSKLVIPNTSIPDSIEGIIALIGISLGILVTGSALGYFIAKNIVKRRYFRDYPAPQSPSALIENKPRGRVIVTSPPLYVSNELKWRYSDANRIDESKHIDYSDGDDDSIYKEGNSSDEEQYIRNVLPNGSDEESESPSPQDNM